MTGFGLLGAGMVAAYHRDAIAATADARLVAVSTHSEDRFAEVAEAFGVPCVTEAGLLADPEIDVVCICTPSGLHAEQALRALEAGKHVLVEKPFALTLEDADAVIEAASERDLRVGVVLQRRADPTFQRIAEAVGRGELGRLVLASVTIPYRRPQEYYDSAAWRGTWELDGGGVLMNQGIHLVDLLVWLLGDPVDVAASAATLARSIEAEDTLVASLRFGSRALATIAATTAASPGSPHRLELYGTDGFVRVEGETVVACETATGWLRAEAGPVESGAGGDPRGIAPVGHTRIVGDFVDALAEGREPLVPAAEGRRSLAAVLAIYEAAGLPVGA